MSTIGIGVVGCGAWGMNHVRVWSNLGRLRAVCDADPGRLAAARASCPEATALSRPEDLWRRDDIDGVVIATPSVTHAALARAALAAGKDVLVEKPLALTVAEAEMLVAEAESRKRILMAGHVLEYHPAIVKLRELVKKGELGQIRYLYSNRLNFGRIRTEESAWWSFAPHDVALILRFAGSLPAAVASNGGAYLNRDVADVTLASLSFESGVRAHIFVSWLHPFKEQRFVIVGERQMAVFDDTRPWAERLTLYPHRVDWVDGRVPISSSATAVLVPLEPGEPLELECRHFLAAIESREPPLSDGASALSVIRVLDAAQRSLESNGTPQPLVSPSPPTVTSSVKVHPSAVVDPGARLGPGTSVWHFSHVMAGATIGANSVLGQNVFVAKNVRIGSRVKIQNNVSVYEGVEIDDEVFCGPSMVFTNVINPRSAIERKSEFRPTRVRRGATLGANCTVICGHDVGRYAFVGAGAVVTANVPDHALVIGVPARIAGWMCECGIRLERDDAGARCGACGLAYRTAGDGLARAES